MALTRRRFLTASAGLLGGSLLAACGSGSDVSPTATRKRVPQPTGEGGAFADNNGVKIYYEVIGSGQPLLLHHGFAGSTTDWHGSGYVTALKDNYLLVIMDARGHGKSDKPHAEADNSVELRISDIIAVLDAVGLDKTHYWGYSMGGRMGFATLQAHPERIASLINGASHSSRPNVPTQRSFAGTLRSGNTQAISDSLMLGYAFAEKLVRENDLQALAACVEGLLTWPGADPNTLSAPSHHYVGDKDGNLGAVRAAAEGMKGTLEVYPGLNHLTCFTKSDLILPAVRKHLQAQPAL